MPERIRTELFYSGLVTTDAAVEILATVPPGERWAVKWYSLFNNTALTGTVFLGVSVASAPRDLIWAGSGVVQYALRQSLCYHVLDEGDELFFFTENNDSAGYGINLSGMAFELS